MRIEVDVTEDDIDQGTKCSETCCPIAIALSRALETTNVHVGRTDWSIWRYDRSTGDAAPTTGGNLPRVASNFVDDFDHDYPVGPFKFTIEVD